MMNSDLYDLIRYHLVPPAFLLFFTVITQVSNKKKLGFFYIYYIYISEMLFALCNPRFRFSPRFLLCTIFFYTV